MSGNKSSWAAMQPARTVGASLGVQKVPRPEPVRSKPSLWASFTQLLTAE